MRVEDVVTAHNGEGFEDGNTVGNDYSYDINGNMIQDLNKGIDDIEYNHLNLPTRVATSQGTIDYVYDAAGIKQRKVVTEGGFANTTDYALNFQYENDRLQFISMPEGYIEPVTVPNAPTTYQYFYQYRDHLDNNRLTFFYNEAAGTVDIAKESNYYPFGLKHQGYNNSIVGRNHRYGFGNKEEQNELGIGWIDITARNYDPSLGRWFVVDALSDQPEQIDKSPYQYGWNNPVYYNDPDGNCPWCIGFIIGAAIEYVSQVVTNYGEGKSGLEAWKPSDPGKIVISGVFGSASAGLSSIKTTTNFGKAAIELTLDMGEEAVTQIHETGELDAKKMVDNIVTGKIVGESLGEIKILKNPSDDNLPMLNRKLDRAERLSGPNARNSRKQAVTDLKNEINSRTKSLDRKTKLTEIANDAADGAANKLVNSTIDFIKNAGGGTRNRRLNERNLSTKVRDKTSVGVSREVRFERHYNN